MPATLARTATVTCRVAGVTYQNVQRQLSRPLLKQFRQLRQGIPEPFRLPHEDGHHPNHTRLNPEYTIGWVHGSVFDDEYSRYVIFAKNGDYYVYSWPGFNPEPWCKQLYV